MKSKIGVRGRIGPLRDGQGKVLTMIGLWVSGEMLNTFFNSVFTRSNNSDRVNMSLGVSDDHVNTGENELRN